MLIPAHNESSGILPTLLDVSGQLGPDDRMVVVADNCTDDTGAISAARGAEIVERNDPDRRGKGFALQAGVEYLRSDPPDFLVVIDADCRLKGDVLRKLTAHSQLYGKPAQSAYLMSPPSADETGPARVAHFGFLMKNYIRPLGLTKLGLPCQLTGSGMIFPWTTIASMDFATDNLVEDVKLGLDLAAAGTAPRFCCESVVESNFPAAQDSRITQRRRWEVGSLRIAVRDAPYFFLKGVREQNFSLIVLALDAAVPPLVVLTVAVAGAGALSLVSLLGGNPVPLYIASFSLLFFSLSIGLSWFAFARHILRLRDGPQLLVYGLQKLRIYRPGRRVEWLRTDRQ